MKMIHSPFFSFGKFIDIPRAFFSLTNVSNWWRSTHRYFQPGGADVSCLAREIKLTRAKSLVHLPMVFGNTTFQYTYTHATCWCYAPLNHASVRWHKKECAHVHRHLILLILSHAYALTSHAARSQALSKKLVFLTSWWASVKGYYH